MTTEFKLPALGEGVDNADIARIYVSEGDTIEADQGVMELETEKAVADLPCPLAGKVAKIHVSEGDTIKVGQTLLTVEEVEAEEDKEPKEKEPSAQEAEAEAEPEEKEDAKAKENEAADKAEKRKSEKDEKDEAKEKDKPSQKSTEEKPKPKPKRADTGGNGRKAPPPAGPATRRLARELHVDLEEFKPPAGSRITQEDVVRAYLESRKLGSEQLPDFSRFGPIERQELGKISRTAAARLRTSWQAIPHVTQHGSADITQLEAARRHYNEAAGEQSPKITLTAIAVKCAAGLLREFPRFNASLDPRAGELVLKRYYHIGVAVDTDHGLVVPVVRDADRKSIRQIAREIEKLAERARDRRLQQENLEGGTFTISNQGGIGGGEFTPIVNFPEVAILGLARARGEVKMIDNRPQERLMLPLSLSYDHRVVNGADAARFVERLSSVLSDCFTLLVAC